MTLYIVASLLPLLALAWTAYRKPSLSWRETGLQGLALLLLLGAAFYTAHPFLHGTAIGTGEAYNYSLSTADAVSQFRDGRFPVLVGQTEYAFNGRIHPLRTAPYLSYAAGLVDLLTFQRLSFWAIQNLVLSLSLLGGALSAYFCLRRIMQGNAFGAALLALAYLLCPAVLAAAYSMDLYMTVAALPFIPLVIGGNARTLSLEPPLASHVQLSAGLAATWLAHPPVALWLTFSTGLFQLGRLLLGRFSPRAILPLASAALLTALLSAFVVVSTSSVTSAAALSAGEAANAVVASIKSTFPASLRPVSASADQLGDFQWGYAHWALLSFAVVLASVRRNRETLLLSGVAIALLVLITPIPGITRWIWQHVPTTVISITSPWPMQRLYLIACVWMLFAVAHSSADLKWITQRRPTRYLALIALLAAVGWTAGQSWRFIKRGEEMQRVKAAASEDLHRSENLNLTVTSYAFFQPPPSFIHAPMDPQMELRLLKRGTGDELATNWTTPEAGQIELQGAFSAVRDFGQNSVFEPQLVLKPNTKYRLDWSFLVPPVNGTLRVVGAHLRREYPLPQAGNAQGFGMLPTNRHGITLWSSAALGDTVQIELIGAGSESPALATPFADFTFSRVDDTQLPMRLVSLLPLRVAVTAPVPAYLETPRMFIEGYKAQVSGKDERVIRSPSGRAMVPVPEGQSVVKLNYTGTRWLNTSFWVSFSSWCGLLGLLAVRTFFPAGFNHIAAVGDRWTSRFFRWRNCVLLAIGLGLGATLVYYASRYMNRAGPIRLKVVFPRGETPRSHPLLTTGRTGAGTFVYVVYKDPTHIQLGFDAWAKSAGLSDPIEIDYFADHELVISVPALYPEGHWKTRAIGQAELERLRQHVVIALNGRIILDQRAHPFESTMSEITIGENRIGGSTTESRFTGTVLERSRTTVERLRGPAQ